uniref:GM01456p n=1 Tax=Drosophila melanogaster TaxID=7227 RepID=Q95SE6_DROME|nr:GM01456p [Drosophila melanogaster]
MPKTFLSAKWVSLFVQRLSLTIILFMGVTDTPLPYTFRTLYFILNTSYSWRVEVAAISCL